MHESPMDIRAMQALLDRSYASASPQLLAVHTPERRLSAEQVIARLDGICVLALATSGRDGRPIVGPVDGVLYRGAFHFGSHADSIRVRQIRSRPWVSATHAPGEELAVTLHGRAHPVDLDSGEGAGLRRALLEVDPPRHGPRFEQLLLDPEAAYFRIEAERMFALAIEPAGEPSFARPLREQDVDHDPVRQFAAWFEAAARAGVRVPEAAALASATAAGAPSVRMVLVKGAGERGFVFYTGYESRKGRELRENPRAALLFHWDRLGRQVRVEGRVERTSPEETAAYVRSRPRGSQASALVSPQSAVIDGREQLERRAAELLARYEGAELPLPEHWGGFRLIPECFEFWQHREDRLHDRLRYTPAGSGRWRLERLAP